LIAAKCDGLLKRRVEEWDSLKLRRARSVECTIDECDKSGVGLVTRYNSGETLVSPILQKLKMKI